MSSANRLKCLPNLLDRDSADTPKTLGKWNSEGKYHRKTERMREPTLAQEAGGDHMTLSTHGLGDSDPVLARESAVTQTALPDSMTSGQKAT